MKLIVLAIFLLSTLALATPLIEKRWVLTSVIYETATVTVTDSRVWWPWFRPTPTPTLTTTPTTAVSIPSVSIVSTSSATSTISTSSISTSDASQPSVSLSAYAQPILEQHNLHRDNHSAPALVWDDRLASIAQEIASSCQYAHNTQAGGGGYGQNIGAGAKPDQIDKMITNQMYNGEMMFYPGYGSEPDMDNFERWGHFSQIVWQATTNIGCYTQHCAGGLAGVSSDVSPYFTVCNYLGAGNVGGQYTDNVLAPRGDATIVM